MSHISGEGGPSPEDPDFRPPSEGEPSSDPSGNVPPIPPHDGDATDLGGPEGDSPSIPGPRLPGDNAIDKDSKITPTTLGYGALDAVLDGDKTDTADTDENGDPDLIDPDTAADVFNLVSRADNLPYGEDAEDLIASAPLPSSAPQSQGIVPAQRTGDATDNITNKTTPGAIEESNDPTVEIPTFTAPYDAIWEAGHGDIQIFRFDDRPCVKIFRHRNTEWTGMPITISGHKLNLTVGPDDIVQIFYPDADGKLRADRYDVFQGIDGLPEGFTAIDARTEAESSAIEETMDPKAFAERSTPNNPLLAAIMNAMPQRREDTSLAGSTVYTSKTDPMYCLVVSPGKEEKVLLVTPDGRLIKTERDAIVREYMISELNNDKKPRLVIRTTAQALAERRFPGYFAF